MSPIALSESAALEPQGITKQSGNSWVKPPQIYGTKEHPYSTLPETTEDLPWADLITLDLSTFHEPGGKEKLAKQLKHAVHNVGFFYVTGFGIPQEVVDRQFGIGKEVFDEPFDIKAKHAADLANGGYNGYTGPDLEHFKKQGAIRRSNIEVWNLPKFTEDFADQQEKYQSQVIRNNIESIEKFGKDVHNNVVTPLLVLFALILELPDEQYFAKRHVYEKKSEDHLRYMKYSARSEAENEEAKSLYTGGHTDLGSITLLFRQPIAALQVLNSNNDSWSWVKPYPGSITVNIADTLQILTGGYLKSSVHRVHAPPKDQTQYDRLGVLVFVRPNNGVNVEVVQDSPVLEAEGIYEKLKKEEEEAGGKKEPLTIEAWVKARQQYIFSKQARERQQQTVDTRTDESEGKERADLKEKVAGVEVKYYS